MLPVKTADSALPLHPLLAERWSPRGFDQTYALAPDELTTLLEAARWSPSAANTQPWRFIVARRGEEAFGRLHAMLMPGNQIWADRASALVLVLAETVDDAGEPRPWALYDTGQSVAHLSTQAHALGLHTHQMGGFDSAAAAAEFALPPQLTPVVVVAIGRLDDKAELPVPLHERERAIRTRYALDQLVLTTEAAASGADLRPAA